MPVRSNCRDAMKTSRQRCKQKSGVPGPCKVSDSEKSSKQSVHGGDLGPEKSSVSKQPDDAKRASGDGGDSHKRPPKRRKVSVPLSASRLRPFESRIPGAAPDRGEIEQRSRGMQSS
ncbi:hypothetical protein FQN50_003028 [Emmonsiellopsis sp. PD_5]|nr:hypothetical protein FQN50_003028 [Emmonsiellopsis sp. PD_5]